MCVSFRQLLLPKQKNNSEMEKAWKKGEERFAKLNENTPMKGSIHSSAQDQMKEEEEQYDEGEEEEESEPYTQ